MRCIKASGVQMKKGPRKRRKREIMIKTDGVLMQLRGGCLLQLRVDRTCIIAFVGFGVRVCRTVKSEENFDIVTSVEDIFDGLFRKMAHLNLFNFKSGTRLTLRYNLGLTLL